MSKDQESSYDFLAFQKASLIPIAAGSISLALGFFDFLIAQQLTGWLRYAQFAIAAFIVTCGLVLLILGVLSTYDTGNRKIVRAAPKP